MTSSRISRISRISRMALVDKRFTWGMIPASSYSAFSALGAELAVLA